MAKPRVFISSTYYDLKQTRENLASFLNGLGYESVRNERGEIPYGNQESLQQYCYKEISNVDIFVSIIGGRFGSESDQGKWSISNEELRTALKENKQVYIFIENTVYNEFGTYQLNKGTDLKYKYVDDVRIYEFIEEIYRLTSNNNIKTFDYAGEIQDYLKEQFAGLFQSFLDSNAKTKDFDLSRQLAETAKKLEETHNQFKELLSTFEKSNNAAFFANHPVVLKASDLLSLEFGIWFHSIETLSLIMRQLGWEYTASQDSPTYEWTKATSIECSVDSFIISKELFYENGTLKPIRYSDLTDDLLRIEKKVNSVMDSTYDGDNLPF